MSDKAIAVAGANQGALAFACFAAENGFEVTVFEKKKRENVSYEWFDDMHTATFEKIGVKRPPVINSTTTPGVKLVSPQKTHSVTITDSDNSADIPVNRRELNEMLYNRAVKAGVKFRYECAVKGVIADGKKINGILLENGESFLCGLTVDCTGAESPLRESLPDCLNIPQRINPDDMFFVTRTYYERTKSTLARQEGRRIFLKHLNERGISWCFPSHDGKAADVLIGRLGKLEKETEQRALYDLKNECDIIGDKMLFGGYLCKIPVRRPISRMVANGFALLGDSAFMTIPMNGSGMSNSLIAAKMLSEVIAGTDDNPFSIKNLYRYQVRYMSEIGAGDAPIELIKNWLLNSEDGDVDFLMEKGILSAEVLGGISGTPDVKTMAKMAKSVISGLNKPLLLIKLLKTVIAMGNQTKTTANMPSAYNEQAFLNWQREYEKAYYAE